jgi:hypothetical protein
MSVNLIIKANMELTTIITAIVSSVLAIASLVFSVYTYNKALIHDRRQATLNAYNLLQEQVFDKLNLYMPAEIRSIAQHPTSKEYKEISGYLARIEHFCVGVNTRIYDRETVYALAHGYMDSPMLLKRIEPLIEKKNHGQEDYYENIHTMLTWMHKRNH